MGGETALNALWESQDSENIFFLPHPYRQPHAVFYIQFLSIHKAGGITL